MAGAGPATRELSSEEAGFPSLGERTRSFLKVEGRFDHLVEGPVEAQSVREGQVTRSEGQAPWSS